MSGSIRSTPPATRPLALILFSFFSQLQAQEVAGTIQLLVEDATGAPVEASGKLLGLATGLRRSFVTDSKGTATLDRLPHGNYRVEISKEGFVTKSVLLPVDAGPAKPIRITLAVGAPAFHVDVVGTTPLAGVDLLSEQVPAPVRQADDADLKRSGAVSLPDALGVRMNGVNLNDIQGNPYQTDLGYRGYSASPLLGTPQGLSVCMDGVRINQPFGDVVTWDLIPLNAIAETTLMPGSNPLFGLNTLGGALSIQTKDGYRAPGFALGLSGGSFGRKLGDLEYGGSNSKGLDWYLAANLFFEDGWRTDSPSNVRQFFGRIGWQFGKTTLGVSVAYANNSLTGNGLQEQALLAGDYSSVYTKPDVTANRSPLVSFHVRRTVSSKVTLSGNAYYRYIRSNVLNGDVNEDSLDQSL
jgi:hypothetical protein